jgi:hypothetical protein
MNKDNMEQHEQDLEEVVNAQTLEEHNLRVLQCPFFLLERSCSAHDWERSGLLEENPQSGCSDICASLKGPV